METLTLVFAYDAEAKLWNGTCSALVGELMQGITLRVTRKGLTERVRQVFPQAELEESVRLPEEDAAALERFMRNRELLQEAERALRRERSAIARRLIHLQMNNTEAARVLQLSPGRFGAQLRPESLAERAS